MTLAPLNIRYPYDPTGRSKDNYVHGELHTLPPVTNRIIVPRLGAFYAKSLQVRQNQKTLVKDVDYELAMLYHDATVETGQDVNVSIYICNQEITGDIELSYQVVGGQFTGVWESIQQYVNVLLVDPRKVRWDDVMDKPELYAPKDHFHDINDVYGLNHLIPKLEEIRQAILRIRSKEFKKVYDRMIALRGDINRAVADANKTITNLQNRLGDNINELNQLKLRVGGLQNRIQALESDKSLAEAVKALREKDRVHENRMSTIEDRKADKTDVENKVNALKGLKADKTALDAVNTQVNTNKESIERLKTLVANTDYVDNNFIKVVETQIGDTGNHLNHHGNKFEGLIGNISWAELTQLKMHDGIDPGVNPFVDYTGLNLSSPTQTTQFISLGPYKHYIRTHDRNQRNAPGENSYLTERLLTDKNIGTALKPDDLKSLISTNPHNMLKVNDDGKLIVNTKPLAEYIDTYVDAVNGNDSNPGTKEHPFRTIQKAVNVTRRSGTGRTIFLHEGQNHIVDAVLWIAGSVIVFRPYGPGLDRLGLSGWNLYNHESVYNLNTQISFKPFRVDNAGNTLNSLIRNEESPSQLRFHGVKFNLHVNNHYDRTRRNLTSDRGIDWYHDWPISYIFDNCSIHFIGTVAQPIDNCLFAGSNYWSPGSPGVIGLSALRGEKITGDGQIFSHPDSQTYHIYVDTSLPGDKVRKYFMNVQRHSEDGVSGITFHGKRVVHELPIRNDLQVKDAIVMFKHANPDMYYWLADGLQKGIISWDGSTFNFNAPIRVTGGNGNNSHNAVKSGDWGLMKLSRQNGNLLSLRDDGLYYGIEAPPNISQLYVSSVSGNDNNPGTPDRPLRTIDAALHKQYPNQDSRTIFLKAGEVFEMNTVYCTISGNLTIHPYGDPIMNVPPSRNINTPNHEWYEWWIARDLRRPRIEWKFDKSTDSPNDRVIQIPGINVEGSSQIRFVGIDIHMYRKNSVVPGRQSTGDSMIILGSGARVVFDGCYFDYRLFGRRRDQYREYNALIRGVNSVGGGSVVISSSDIYQYDPNVNTGNVPYILDGNGFIWNMTINIPYTISSGFNVPIIEKNIFRMISQYPNTFFRGTRIDSTRLREINTNATL